MPTFKHRVVLELARGFKVFLKLEAGFTRGEPPDLRRQANRQAEQLSQARETVKNQARQIERLRARLQVDDQPIAMPQAAPRKADRGKTASGGARPKAEGPRRLTILDDVFPHALSPFRITEYNAYLRRWKDAVVLTTASSFGALRDTRSFEEALEEYVNLYPEFDGRVLKCDPDSDMADLLTDNDSVYTMFLYNAHRFLPLVHEYDLPFAFTLYPGGRFRLGQEDSDRQLRDVCSSPNLKKVIVTQKVARDYLIEKGFCGPEDIEFVYGGVFSSDRLLAGNAKRFYRKDKPTFDVCFVAHKYTKGGVDKGYDTFVEAAKLLSESHDDVFFHVVGPFDRSDMNVGELKDRIAFYGTRSTDFFREFYPSMDIILSPNVPFVLAPGAFDGFPTGGCIEAGLSGVAVFCTDPLDQNITFRDGEDLVIVPRDAASISEIVSHYHERPERLYDLAARGQKAFREIFAPEAQMGPRFGMLSELLGSPSDAPKRGS